MVEVRRCRTGYAKWVALVALWSVLQLLCTGIVSAEVLAHWSFNEGSGTSTNSSVGGYTGTLVDFADTSTGAGNAVGSSGWTNSGSLNFDNTGGHVETDFSLAVLQNQSFSVEFIATHNDASLGWSSVTGRDSGKIFFLGKEGNSTRLHANLDAVDSPSQGLGRQFSDSATSICDGALHHVAVVFDDVNNTQKLYFDYELVGTLADVTGTLRCDGNLWIGRDALNGFGWDGYVSELRISQGVLTTDDFLQEVPEPSAFVLLGFGAFCLIARRRLKR